MERFKRALLVNLAAFVSLIPVTVSGFILWFVVPGGHRHACRQTFLEITRLAWIDLHSITGILVVLLVVGHLLLHRSYLRNVPRMLRQF